MKVLLLWRLHCVRLRTARSGKKSDKDSSTRTTSMPQQFHKMTNDCDSWVTLLLYITVNVNTHPQSTVLFQSGLLLLISPWEIKVLHTSSPTKRPLYGDPMTCSITLTQSHFIYVFITDMHQSMLHKIPYPPSQFILEVYMTSVCVCGSQ